MNKTSFVFLVGWAVLLLLCTIGRAQTGQMKGRIDEKVRTLTERLSLDDKQAVQVRVILEKYRSQALSERNKYTADRTPRRQAA